MSKRRSLNPNLNETKGALRQRRIRRRPVPLKQMQRTPGNHPRAQVVDCVHHLLTLAGVFAVQRGLADKATVELITGGLVALVGLFWPFARHKKPKHLTRATRLAPLRSQNAAG